MATHNQISKRIVFVHGDKGGVGKSVFSRELLDRYIRLNVAVDAYDSDKRNPDLSRYYNRKVPVTQIDLSSKTAFDTLFDKISEGQNRALVDLAAGAGDALKYLVNGDIKLAGTLKELGARLTIVFVLNRSRSSLAALHQAFIDLREVPVDWIVVRNNHYGEPEKYIRYANSNTRIEAKSRGAIELDMPELLDDLYDDLDQSSVPFCEAVDSEKLSFTNKRRIRAWLEKFDGEIDRAMAVL